MSNVTDLVQVTVNIADVSLTLPGFGTPIILGPLVEFEDRFQNYGSLTAVGEVFDSSSAFYRAAQAAFGQEFSPETVKIGRQQVDITGVQITTVADSGDTVLATVALAAAGDYTVSLRDNAGAFETFTHSAGAGESTITIAGALVALINGSGSLDVTATDNGDGTFSLTSDVADQAFQFAFSGDTKSSITATGGYNVNISGTVNGTTSVAASTNLTIAADMVLSVTQAITDATLPITVADSGGGVYTVTANPLGSTYSLRPDTQQTIDLNYATGRTGLSTLTASTTETLTEALSAIEQTSADGADFYAVISTSIIQADVEEIALGVEAQTRIFGTTTSDVNVLNAAIDTDVASVLQSQSLDRTWVLYTDDSSQFGDAAWFGRMLPVDVGSDTWNLKPLAGVTVSDLTDSQKAAARGKNCNIFIDFAGNARTNDGRMASGRFIDVQRSQDFMETDIAAAVALRLLQSPKVPYTDAGGRSLGSIVAGRMQAFNTQGILGPLLNSDSGELYRVTVPKVADQSAVDRANRHFAGIVAEGQLAGAIHTVEITVNVSV